MRVCIDRFFMPYYNVLHIMQCNTESEVDIMAISLRLSEEENALFKAYAEIKGMSLSEMIRKTVLEKIEDEYDLKSFNEAMEEYKKNPVTYTHEEVAMLLDLD